MSRLLLAAVLLSSSLPARAQVEVRTATVLPPSASALVLAPAAVLAPSLAPSAAPAAMPALIASPLAAPSAPAPAPAASAAPAAAAAAMSGALGEFGKLDLKNASAADARGAGEDLMLRALGAAPAEAAAAVPGIEAASAPLPAPSDAGSAPRAQPKIYLLSKPLRETVRLGPVSIALHAAGALLWELTKAAVAWKATGSFAAAATVFAFESTTSPVMLSARSLADLGFRYWRRKLGVLKELARTPAVSRVKILTTGDVSFWGPFARGKDNTGLIFVESHDPLPQAMGRFGAPIPLGDVAATRVRLVYIQDGQTSAVAWTPTLKDLLDGEPIPAEIAKAWRAEVDGGVMPNPLKMIDVTGAKGKARLEATLLGADGTETDIGAISEGPAARALIGLGLLDRARAFLGRERPVRSIPISDSTIERRGDAREPGFAAVLRRGWGRLSGRLIVGR
jgi:hypothetical protein